MTGVICAQLSLRETRVASRTIPEGAFYSWAREIGDRLSLSFSYFRRRAGRGQVAGQAKNTDFLLRFSPRLEVRESEYPRRPPTSRERERERERRERGIVRSINFCYLYELVNRRISLSHLSHPVWRSPDRITLPAVSLRERSARLNPAKMETPRRRYA